MSWRGLTLRRASGLLKEFLDVLDVRRAGHALVGDDGGDEFVGCYVKGVVADWGELVVFNVGDFAGRVLRWRCVCPRQSRRAPHPNPCRNRRR